MYNLPKPLDTLLKSFDELLILQKDNRKEVSKIDLELSDFYHRIEGTKFFNPIMGIKLLLELQEILKKRRDIKRDDILLSIVCDSLEPIMKEVNNKVKIAANRHEKLITSLNKNGITENA